MKSLKLFLLLLIGGTLSFNSIAQIDEPLVSAVNLNVGTVINWTIDDLNEDLQFIVEKSSNGKNFFPVFDCASQNATLNYSFLDINAKDKITYYRIKQMTSDGTFSYSETTQVQLVYQNNLVVTSVSDLDATKNRGQLSIALSAAQNGELTYSIEDTEQVIMTAGTQLLVEGNNQLTLDFSLFPKGEYAVKMQLGDEIDILLLEKQEDMIRLEAGIINQKLGELVRKQ